MTHNRGSRPVSIFTMIKNILWDNKSCEILNTLNSVHTITNIQVIVHLIQIFYIVAVLNKLYFTVINTSTLYVCKTLIQLHNTWSYVGLEYGSSNKSSITSWAIPWAITHHSNNTSCGCDRYHIASNCYHNCSLKLMETEICHMNLKYKMYTCLFAHKKNIRRSNKLNFLE